MTIYATRHTRAECAVNTFYLCLGVGRGYVWLRIVGFEVGVTW